MPLEFEPLPRKECITNKGVLNMEVCHMVVEVVPGAKLVVHEEEVGAPILDVAELGAVT